jgi:hypothetical protein
MLWITLYLEWINMRINVLEYDSRYELEMKLNTLYDLCCDENSRFDVQFSTYYTSGSRAPKVIYCALVMYEEKI